MNRLMMVAGYVLLLLLPATAHAYVGPGAGLSLLGALWAMLLALLAVLFFVFAWPIRRMLRRRREARADAENTAQEADDRESAKAYVSVAENENPGTEGKQ